MKFLPAIVLLFFLHSTAMALQPATNITASDGTSDFVYVEWTASPDADYFKVYVSSTVDSIGVQKRKTTDTIVSMPADEPLVPYYYRVESCVGEPYTGVCYGASDEYDTGFAAPILPAPTSVSASDALYWNEIHIDWDKVTHATSYKVHREQISTGFYTEIAEVDAPAVSFVDSTFDAVTNHYMVQACYNDICGLYSFPEEGSVINEKPDPPGWITASNDSNEHIQVDWKPVDGAIKYRLHYSTSKDDLCEGLSYDIDDATSFFHTSATPLVDYYYRVEALTLFQISDCSDAMATGIRQMPLPSNPTVTASDGGDYAGFILVQFGASHATSYELYRSITAGKQGTKIADTASYIYHDYSAEPGQIYHYSIIACNSEGCTDLSEQDSGYRSIDKPGAPISVEATDGDSTENIVVSWVDNYEYTDRYEVYYYPDTPDGEGFLITSLTEKQYTHEAVASGRLYYYRIKACNDTGCSDLSEYDSGYRKLYAPRDLTATSDSPEVIELGWSSVNYATSYQIYRSNPNGQVSDSSSAIGEVSETSYLDTAAMMPGATYQYAVKACTDVCCSELSSHADGAKTYPTTPDISASDGTSPQYITITWTLMDGMTSYEVYRSESSVEVGEKVGTMGHIQDTLHDQYNLIPTKEYFYRVKPCNLYGCGNISAPDSGYKLGIPLPPSGVNASDGTSAAGVEVMWPEVFLATSYEVYMGASENATVGILLDTVYTNEYLHNVSAQTTGLYYGVKACNDYGCSDYSNWDSGYRAEGLPAPSFVNASDGKYSDRVEVFWSAVSGAVYYEVFRFQGLVQTQTQTIEHTDSDVELGITYQYFVRACNADGCGESTSDEGYITESNAGGKGIAPILMLLLE